jgi:uncharacterized repeat protein (TIGR03803 family)
MRDKLAGSYYQNQDQKTSGGDRGARSRDFRFLKLWDFLNSWVPTVVACVLLTLATTTAHAQFVFADVYDFASPGGYSALDISPLTLWTDGNLYGTTQFGGGYGCGTIFGVSTSSYSDVYSFNGKTNHQCDTLSGLTQDNGYFYGAAGSSASRPSPLPAADRFAAHWASGLQPAPQEAEV